MVHAVKSWISKLLAPRTDEKYSIVTLLSQKKEERLRHEFHQFHLKLTGWPRGTWWVSYGNADEDLQIIPLVLSDLSRIVMLKKFLHESHTRQRGRLPRTVAMRILQNEIETERIDGIDERVVEKREKEAKSGIFEGHPMFPLIFILTEQRRSILLLISAISKTPSSLFWVMVRSAKQPKQGSLSKMATPL